MIFKNHIVMKIVDHNFINPDNIICIDNMRNRGGNLNVTITQKRKQADSSSE